MKSITKNLHLDAVTQKLACFFSQAEDVARATRFVQRKSPLTGWMFFQALVVGFLKFPKASLNPLAQECARLGFPISPQGLHGRINARSEAFLKAMYQDAFEQFKNQLALPIAILNPFSQILVVDSTFKGLPDSLQGEFPGPGGKADQASLKVQLVFEFIYGNLTELTLQAGRAADQAYTQYLELVQVGGLVILDLGYFCLASLHTLAHQGAYFLLRYHYPTALYGLDGTRLDLFTLLETQATVDRPVLLGASLKKPIACRLISVPVPLGVAEERRRKAKRKAAQHRKTLSEVYLKSLGWSVFLTNVPSDRLTTQAVIAFYHIRWQIELIFKFWKSYCGLDYQPGVRAERVMTEFYAKLLVAVLSNYLIAPVRLPDETHPRQEISAFQVRKILADFAQDLVGKLFDRPGLRQVLEQFYCQVARYAFKQIRRKKPNVLAMLSGLSISNAEA